MNSRFISVVSFWHLHFSDRINICTRNRCASCICCRSLCITNKYPLTSKMKLIHLKWPKINNRLRLSKVEMLTVWWSLKYMHNFHSLTWHTIEEIALCFTLYFHFQELTILFVSLFNKTNIFRASFKHETSKRRRHQGRNLFNGRKSNWKKSVQTWCFNTNFGEKFYCFVPFCFCAQCCIIWEILVLTDHLQSFNVNGAMWQDVAFNIVLKIQWVHIQRIYLEQSWICFLCLNTHLAFAFAFSW